MNDLNNRIRGIIVHNIKYCDLLLNNTSLITELEESLNLILNTKGKLVFSGIGKSGIIAQKICASFISTGTIACFLHPTEAMHGDIGVIQDDDVLICISNSGNTEELAELATKVKERKIKIIVITANPNSILAKMSDASLVFANQEASAIGAPTTSCIISLLIGDILCILTYEAKGFSKQDYLALHPGGAIGVSLRDETL